MVALISVIVSTIGVIVSAGSSLIAWQQVEMLRNERMTPYRAILYNAKVEAFTEIVGSATEFRTASNTLGIYYDYIHVRTLAPSVRNKDNGGYTIIVSSNKGRSPFVRTPAPEDIRMLTDVINAGNAFRISGAKYVVVWPSAITDQIVEISRLAEVLRNCAERIVGGARTPGVWVRCSPAHYQRTFSQFETQWPKLEAAMRAEIMDERLRLNAPST